MFSFLVQVRWLQLHSPYLALQLVAVATAPTPSIVPGFRHSCNQRTTRAKMECTVSGRSVRWRLCHCESHHRIRADLVILASVNFKHLPRLFCVETMALVRSATRLATLQL
jgi:hypothetical protein